jgi:LmbE family N-acetylglucosaminyl deacetylase
MKKLLAIFAHPDDETFGPGGTLALYARREVEVHLICATRGEAGKIPAELTQSYETVAQLREAELRCAAAELGLAEIHFLGYRDSGMAGTPENDHPNALDSAPLEEVTAKITNLIRRIRPQVVITHDPQGGYLHPDHIAMHKAAVAAFLAASDPTRFPTDLPAFSPKKLYFTLIPMKFLRLAVRLMPILGVSPKHFGRNHDIDLSKLVKAEYPVHARINIRSVADIKNRASECHASQLDRSFQDGGVMGWILHQLTFKETFMRAQPPATNRLRENDLFAEINE